MSLLKQFEKEAHINAESLTEEKLIEIMNNENLSYFFSKPADTVELFDDLISRNKNSDFVKELNTVRHTFNMTYIENLLSLLFFARQSEEIDDEKFQDRILKNFESSDPLFSISTLTCLLLSKYNFPKAGEDEYFEIFKNNIFQLGEIFLTLGRVENSYRFRTEILDLIYTLREEYFVAFNKDILEDSVWQEREIQILNDFEEQFMNSNEIESVDISPNSLGLIDITKLPKDDE